MPLDSPALGALPEWNLGDLYTSGDSEAFRNDLKSGRALADTFGERYRGKLGELASGAAGGDRLAEADRKSVV